DMQLPDHLLAVGRAGARVNNNPVGELSARGNPVFKAPRANANPVKELVLGSLFIAARNLVAAHEYVRQLEEEGEALSRAVEAGKKRFVGIELPGRTLGVIGLGAIGVEVANAALSLGMNVIGYDPKITVERAWQLSAGVQQAVSIEEVLRRSNFTTIHVPLTDSTQGMLSAKHLKLMRKDSVLLNFSRNEIVDEKALLDALNEGVIATYVTDFPTVDFKKHPRAVCLPHLGASTAEAEENSAVMVVDNLRQYLEHGNVKHSVNFPETVLLRTRPNRVAIPHANIPNMVAQILSALAAENINIADLVNHSRDTISYTIVDLDAPVSETTLARIRSIDGILSARICPE
ncbi:MAG: phosphoglycerate dehydrogenase, partial [Gammaproteobacteria bacterium]|nr:phosphoglycerate dehydrogenase [Gammaproteobacteria bacterium]